MQIKIEDLQEGCILTEDVFSLSNRPIISKNSVVTREIMDVLKAFLVKEVDVANTLVTGLPFAPSLNIKDELAALEVTDDNKTLFAVFLHAAQQYEKEFKGWQSGMPVEIQTIRNFMLPLIEKMEEATSADIFSLYHLSTEEQYIYQHAVAVGTISAYIGKKLNMEKGKIIQLALGGCLSDCGMAKIKPSILNKKGSLTAEEFDEIKRHSIYSYKMLQNISSLSDLTKAGIIQHHERLDGSGYPLGDRDQKVNEVARIIAVADVFHAMTSQRQYRRKQSPFKVLELLLEDSFGKYDITAIQAVASGMMNFSVGSKVKLSDGQVAHVLFNEEKSPTRPLVKLDESGEIIHLERHRQIYIEEVLS
ncbi:HD-GYP domain-containing protein [Cytobacillus gottheilii]|uniref:HD-GYP domain-containing protein n=1 Tax=Cytobacillus gottheilii TaxID=859144 RepID=UPI0009BAE4A6|nr:HD-GYP domain-containing protein [Cytobacillus gottheilii]